MIKVFNKEHGRRINGAGDGGVGLTGRRAGRGLHSAEPERERGHSVADSVPGRLIPPAGPANLQACRYHHKREAWLRIHDGVTTRDFRLILGLENAVPPYNPKNQIKLIFWEVGNEFVVGGLQRLAGNGVSPKW